jgi:thiol-disulfide isomerase/thioredoxin
MNKKTIRLAAGYLIAIVMVFTLFTLASYANTFSNQYANFLLKFVSLFACGLLLRQYFTKGQAIVSAFLYISFLLFVHTPFEAYRFYITLPAYSFSSLGFVLGYFFNKISTVKRVAFLAATVAWAWLNAAVIYPSFMLQKMDMPGTALPANKTTISNIFSNVSLMKDDADFTLAATGNKVYLVDFFFNNCRPCRAKEPYVLALEKAVNDSNFQVLYIESGKLDSYEVYKQNYERLHGKVLYDKGNKLIDSLKIEGFPFEIIIDKKGVVRHISNGFGNDDLGNKYVQQTKEKIQKLLHE